MTLSDFRRITDELLSAYIDDEVTEQERALVDAAAAADEGIAWRLNSLRQTVTLLHDLPEVVLPRSFTLTFDQVRLPQTDGQIEGVGATEQPPVMLPTAHPRQSSNVMPIPQANAGFWGQMQEGWRRFWQVGNPVLRNAAAVSFALMLLITSGGQMLSRALTQPMGMMTTSSESAPAAASSSDEAAVAVALAPTATESNETGSSASELQQEPAANKALSGESARSVQAQAVPASTEAEAPAAEDAASDTTESPMVASEAATPSDEDNPTDNEVVQEGEQAEEAEAVVAEAAPSSDSSQAAPAAESAAVAAMAAPEIAPLFPEGPRSQMGGGDGLGAGGSMDGLPPQMGGGEAGLVPQQAYGFDASPEGQPPMPYSEEAVSASVAAAPAAEAPAESVADVAVTPAVDAPVVAATSASITTATEVTSGITEEEIPESATTPEESTEATGVEAPVEAPVEATVEPTPEAVALVAPEPITSSEVIENVPVDGAVVATGTAENLPVVGVAQGTFLLLTIMLTSLWWRSRTPRRPQP